MMSPKLGALASLALVAAGLAYAAPSAAATGNTYYVATTGSDTNSGTIDSPFKTIGKASAVLGAGDTVLIRGGTYNETITPQRDGAAGSPITYKPYGSETVTISGNDPVTGWTSDSGSVYKAPMSWDLGDENQVFVAGERMRLAQYPNWTTDSDVFDIGWKAMDSGTATSITDSTLNKAANYWVGATVIVKGWWSTQSAKVTSSSGSTINFTALPWSDGYTNPGGSVKFMISGVKGELDRQKEWYYDKNAQMLYLWAPGGVNPSTLAVEAKKRKYAVDLTGRSYIDIEGIRTLDASITTKSASHNMIKGITAKYLSHTIGLQKAYSYDDTGIDLSGSYNTIRDSELQYSSGNGVVIRGDNNNVINNLIHDTDYLGTYNASVAIAGGNKHLISYNTLYNTGRTLIGGEKFSESIIERNDLSHTGKLSYDLGGIYFARVDGGNTEIRYNWIHDMDSQSCTSCELGVYIDSNTHNFLIHHNTVWNASTAYYFGGRADNILIYSNQSKPHISVNTSDYKYNDAVTDNIAENGVSFDSGASASSAYTDGNVTTGYDQSTFGTPGYSATTPPNPVYSQTLPDYANRGLNYGFEADLGGWSVTGDVTYHYAPMLNLGDQQATTRTADGSALFGSGQAGIRQDITGLQPNTMYEFSGWAKVASGEEAWLGVMDYGTADTHKVVTNTSNGWKHVLIQFTTGAGNTSATIYMKKNSTGSGAVYGDDIGLRKLRPSELPSPDLIPQSQMTATATSQETVQENDAASQAIDGDPSTMWHTKWDGSNALPQSITLNLGGTYTINRITYLPRQSGTGGIITGYNVYTSTDGSSFSLAGSGTWANDSTKKTATFTAVGAAYVKLEAVASPTAWASAAEINVLKDPGGAGGSSIAVNNAGFESGAKPNWAGWGAWSVVSSDPHSGSYNAQVVANSSTEQSITGLSANTTYTLKAWVKTSDSSSPAFLGVKGFGGTEKNVQVTGTSYQQYSTTFTTGSSNTTALIYLWRNGSGAGSASGDDFTIDAATTPVTTSYNDNVTGTGSGQFDYVSSGSWSYGSDSRCYGGDNHWSNTTDAYVQVRFSGTQIVWRGAKAASHGIAAVSIDGGAETTVDLYASTRADDAVLYTSPTLSAGAHTLKVRVTGTKNASSTNTWISVDRVEVTG